MKSGYTPPVTVTLSSLPTRGAWIEMGLRPSSGDTGASLPTRGAWIEIWTPPVWWPRRWGRSPHGERGLKSANRLLMGRLSGRSPHGERGLKLPGWPVLRFLPTSLPTRGAWIEIPRLPRWRTGQRSLPTRGAWIEIHWGSRSRGNTPGRSPHGERGLKYQPQVVLQLLQVSLPTRGAWIEIWPRRATGNRSYVAPHTGSVD